MPCSDSDRYPTDAQRMKEKVDKLTRMLCGVMKEVERCAKVRLAVRMKNLDGELLDWWEEHKSVDAERIEREEAQRRLQQVRKRALQKLSDEEKDALGIVGIHPPWGGERG